MIAERLRKVLTPRHVAAAILVAGFAVTLAVNLPGHFEFDSIRQLIEGRTGVYSNWHPPVMSWLLGVADALVPGASPFVVLDASLAFGAILSLLWLVPRPRWPVVAAAALGVALPQLFLFQAIVWKDMLFADALLAGFAALAHAAGQRGRPRLALLGLAAVLLALAALTRQNGATILPCAALVLGWVAAQESGWRRGLRAGAGFLAVCVVLAIGANALLQLRASQALGAVEQIEDLQLYDIAGLMARDPKLTLPILDAQAPGMAKVMREKGAALYTPAGHDRLSDESGMGPFIVSSVGPVRRQWWALVTSRPLAWLAVRAADFAWAFTSTHPEDCMTYAVGIDGPAEDMKAAGLTPRRDARDEWLDDSYATPLLETPALSHPVFAGLGALCLVLLLWRRRPADLAMAGLLIAAALYAASYFVIAISCEYRYLFAIDLSAIAAAFYLAMDWRIQAKE
ncbi:MAG TPA: hypothetical protein VHZ78_10840 [Rhizomicrobium sp.]|nr:hypothetical protein [Rhizomicrobium sp.]